MTFRFGGARALATIRHKAILEVGILAWSRLVETTTTLGFGIAKPRVSRPLHLLDQELPNVYRITREFSFVNSLRFGRPIVRFASEAADNGAASRHYKGRPEGFKFAYHFSPSMLSLKFFSN